jgi:hypothetical protein
MAEELWYQWSVPLILSLPAQLASQKDPVPFPHVRIKKIHEHP